MAARAQSFGRADAQARGRASTTSHIPACARVLRIHTVANSCAAPRADSQRPQTGRDPAPASTRKRALRYARDETMIPQTAMDLEGAAGFRRTKDEHSKEPALVVQRNTCCKYLS